MIQFSIIESNDDDRDRNDNDDKDDLAFSRDSVSSSS